MPAASPAQRQSNLARLTGALSHHCPASEAISLQASTWAALMPLTHATPIGKLRGILREGALLSQIQLGLPLGHAEATLETGDDVFLYAAPFSYPNTECGFLFTASLEGQHTDDGVATPFDSGALAAYVAPPAPYVDPILFVRDHELPVSDYRNTLGSVMADYYPSPDQYISHPDRNECHCGASRCRPCGIVGGDHRTNTFEVRIPQRVPLQPPHLRAVFVRGGYEVPELSELFAAGVTIERYEAEEGDVFFHAMRECCVTFIQTHLLP